MCNYLICATSELQRAVIMEKVVLVELEAEMWRGAHINSLKYFSLKFTEMLIKSDSVWKLTQGYILIVPKLMVGSKIPSHWFLFLWQERNCFRHSRLLTFWDNNSRTSSKKMEFKPQVFCCCPYGENIQNPLAFIVMKDLLSKYIAKVSAQVSRYSKVKNVPIT